MTGAKANTDFVSQFLCKEAALLCGASAENVGPYPVVPLPVSEHGVEVATIRVLATHVARRDRRAGEG